MKKHLHIVEYSRFGKIPVKESFEHEVTLDNGNIIRTSVHNDVEENDYISDVDRIINVYNNESKIEEKNIDLDNVIIYDNLDIESPQSLAYVYECPICLNTTITTDPEIDMCPQCGNKKYPFNVIALINTNQMEEIATEDDDVSSLIIIKDNKLEILPRKQKENMYE